MTRKFWEIGRGLRGGETREGDDDECNGVTMRL